MSAINATDTHTTQIPMPKPGTIMPDNTIFAGYCIKKQNFIFVAQKTMNEEATYHKAKRRVKRWNSAAIHGHDDWRIGECDEVTIIRDNASFGELQGKFAGTTYWAGKPFTAYNIKMGSLIDFSCPPGFPDKSFQNIYAENGVCIVRTSKTLPVPKAPQPII